MSNQYLPTSAVSLRKRTASANFLKSINRIADRDTFSPKAITLEKPHKHINRNSSEKVCTKCKVHLVAGENITNYRYARSYFLCAKCFSELHQVMNQKRPSKDLSTLLQLKKARLQERISKLMDQLAYINAMGIK
jgi:hypothetical protein